MGSGYVAFADESIIQMPSGRQAYRIGAALLATTELEAARDVLRPLLLPGQSKLHWRDESPPRRDQISRQVAATGSMLTIVTHWSEVPAKEERSRRKCLERLYYELASMDVQDASLECRQQAQDAKDIRHIVALQARNQAKNLRLSHLRGKDEPLLWIPDAVLGALNAAQLGEPRFWDQVRDTVC
ncbi:hypothetical protein [Corynebacterium frankenforstense]|uniref:hypothetical protein n=1 Tax=Corynebacterium frankenforstense TaxID=1230998 RepID=UPI0026EE67F3|nr:hypothetical protein [Corynebacterium frankenforstense]